MQKNSEEFHHIVLFRLHDGVADIQKQQVIHKLEELGKNNPDILRWVIAESKDTRKGSIIIEDAIFKNEDVFQKFRASDLHGEVAQLMTKIADWWVGDYILK